MISDQEIIEFLEKQDVTVGKKINEINFPQLEYSIRQSFAQMAWVTIYMERNNLCVEIRESLYDVYDDMQSSSGRYDLIANKDAYIYSIITRSGSAVVKDGMYVKKGDVLVKGICKIYDDFGTVKEELKLRADAKILADVDYTFLAPLTEIEIVALKIAGLYSDEMLNYIGNIKFSQFIEKLEENGVIILNKHVMIEKKEKAIYYRGFIHAREEIGMNVPVEDLEVNEFE